MRSYLPLPPAFLCASIVSMTLLHFLAPVARLIPSPWKYLGIVPILFGVVINIWADILFKKSQTTVKPFLRPTALVSSGPFRLSRHPMYLGMIAIVFGLAVALGSATPMIVVVCFALLLAVMFVPMEEKAAEEEFGDSWREYKSRVRKWL